MVDGRRGGRHRRAIRFGHGTEDGQADAEEGNAAHDEVADSCAVRLFQVVLLQSGQCHGGDFSEALDFIAGQPAFLRFAKRCPEDVFDGKRGEALAGWLAQLQGDEAAFIVEKNHGPDGAFVPSVGVVLGDFLEALQLF